MCVNFSHFAKKKTLLLAVPNRFCEDETGSIDPEEKKDAERAFMVLLLKKFKIILIF